MQPDSTMRRFVASSCRVCLFSAVLARNTFSKISFHHSSYTFALRLFGYSAYDSFLKPPKRRTTHGGSSGNNSNNNSDSDSGTQGNEGAFVCSTQSSSSTRAHERSRVFPETLKSGRYKQQKTGSQRLYYGDMSSSAASPPDRRFYRKVEDYREVQDDDPYAGVFCERTSVKKRRVKEWQRQFEEENADVELPYERTNVLARLAPNWFVRYFLNIRDDGGMNNYGVLWACVLFPMGVLWLVGYLIYAPPSKARPIAEVR